MITEDIKNKNKNKLNINQEIKTFDTTLRDGEQTPGVALTVDEKIRIAQKLDNLGVNTIEVGFPATSNGEKITAKKIKELNLNSNICGLARCVKNDVNEVIDSDLDYIHIFIGTSHLHREYKLKMSKEAILEKAIDTIEYSKSHGLKVEFSPEDSTRTETDYLFKVLKNVESAGVDIINIPDTVGILTPTVAKSLIENIKREIKKPISVHFHNDFGLAVANSLMAIEAGANQAHLTVNGIGERGGNASLEEFIISLKMGYNIDLGIDTKKLYDISDFVSRATGIKLPQNKPIVGENAFAHESGIHVHGILENTMTYEPIPPELVGHKRKIALGKHTGANALKSKLNEYDIKMNEEQFCSVYNQIKDLGDKGKCITDLDLKAIALTELTTAKEKSVKLLGLSVISGSSVSPTATVKLSINGEEKETSEIGVGPIDAALNGIQKLVQDTTDIELEEYHIEAITGGTDALADVFVRTNDGQGNITTGRAIRDDVIMASVVAVLDSINKSLMLKENN